MPRGGAAAEPAAPAGMVAASTGSTVFGVGSARLASLRTGAMYASAAGTGFATGNQGLGSSVWIRPFASFADQDLRDGIAGFDAETGEKIVPVLQKLWTVYRDEDATLVEVNPLVKTEEGQIVDFKTFMVPREKYTIVDVWNMVGLAGTGSNDIVVEDVFIPEAFTLSMGETGQCRGPGQEQNTSDLYKLPFHSIFTGTITTPIIGMAMGAYDEHVEMQQKRTRAAYLGEKASLDPFSAVRIAKASSEIDAAWALLVNNIREEQDYVAKGEKIPLKTRLKVRRDQVLGSQRAIDAIDALFEASGGRALANGTYLQRAWRDAHAGRVHAANDPERALQMYGAHEFGHKIDPGMY